MEQAQAAKVNLDSTTLEFTARMALERLIDQLAKDPENTELMDRLEARLTLVKALPFRVVLWKPQNIWFEMRRTVFEDVSKRAAAGDAAATAWVDRFRRLGQNLSAEVN
jgi:hypothetical protein